MHGTPGSERGNADELALLRALEHLETEGDPVAVVRFVERWADDADVPAEARIVEARAFVALFQVDRAWVRLKEVLSDHPEAADALGLLVDVFVLRGWPARAAEPLSSLERVAPDHPELDRLRAAVGAPVTSAPDHAREVERSGDAAQVLPLVEHYLATGSVLRAQSLLERLRRGGAEDDPRVSALLWGIRGEYLDSPGILVDALARVQDAAPAGATPVTEDWGGVDHTETLRMEPGGPPATLEVGRDTPGRSGVSFPSLFRAAPGRQTERVEDDEVTMASVMARSEQLQEPSPSEHAALGPGGDEEADSTQILEFIPASGGGAPSDGPDVDPLRRPVDLREFQAAQEADPSDAEDDGWPEEDGDLVVMTRREPLEDPISETAPQGLVGVIEKVPVPPPLPEGLPGEDEDTPPLTAAVDGPLLEESVGGDRDVELEWRASGGGERHRIGLGIGLGVALGGAIWVGIRHMEAVATDGLVEEVHRSVLLADTQALEGLSTSLQEELSRRAAHAGVLSAELAIVESVLYRDHVGGMERLERARAAAAVAASDGVTPREELALAEGALRWAEGDHAGTLAALSGASDASLIARRLVTATALEHDDDEAAKAAWRPLDEAAQVPWLAALEPGVAALDDAASLDAVARLSGLGDVALVPLVAEGWTGAPPDTRIKAIDALLQRGQGLPVQAKARLLAAKSLLVVLDDVPRARAIAEEATTLSPSSAEAWFAAGVTALHDGQVRQSLAAFEACTAARPRGRACERGEVQALLELDRLDEAAVRAQSPDLRAWVSAERGESAVADGPLGGYIAGVIAVSEEEGTVPPALEASVGELKRSAALLDRMLAARAEALRLRILGRSAGRAELEALRASHGREPLVAVHLAARAEALGESGVSARLLAQAALDSPESARVHHARGLLIYTPRTVDAARTAWRRYLELEPSGPRAERVRSRVGG